MKPYTHILETFPELTEEVPVQTNRGLLAMPQTKPSQAMLYRASDGMCIAARQSDVISCGEDMQKADVRRYRDETYATMALRRFADKDWRRSNGAADDDETYAASIHEVDGVDKKTAARPKIVQPNLGDIGAVAKSKQ